jgi:hypothetical protein
MIDDNLADYADPIIYDRENSSFEPDGPFFLEMAGQAGGPVLDLGCGSGRITIPLTQQGDVCVRDRVLRSIATGEGGNGRAPLDRQKRPDHYPQSPALLALH